MLTDAVKELQDVASPCPHVTRQASATFEVPGTRAEGGRCGALRSLLILRGEAELQMCVRISSGVGFARAGGPLILDGRAWTASWRGAGSQRKTDGSPGRC